MSSKVRVLVVDDDFDSRSLLELLLSGEGYAVTLASNGAEALVAARQHHPHLILLDLAMPVMDGFAFRAAQLRDPHIAGIPVICVSGRHDAHQVTGELKLTACVSKPFSLDEIVIRVQSIAGRSHGRDESSPPARGGLTIV